MKSHYQLSVLVLVISFASVSALTCHTCYSERSWFDCMKSIKKMKCPEGFDTCATIQRVKKASSGKEFFQFAKTCYQKEVCSVEQCIRTTNTASDTWIGIDCDIGCCDTDFCNASWRSSASSLVLMACAAVVLILATF